MGDPGSYIATYSHDSLGRLQTAVDPNSDYDFDYNELSRPSYVVQQLNVFPSPYVADFEYDYDLVGRVVQRQLRENVFQPLFTTNYKYDDLDRIELVTEPALGLVNAKGVAFDYVAFNAANNGGQLENIVRYINSNPPTSPNGTHISHTNFAYYDDNRLMDIDHYGQAVPLISRYSYFYDVLGRILRFKGPNNTTVRKYNYDDRNQLTQTADDGGAVQETFNYDANGNRLYDTTQFNRLRDDGSNRYEYDAEGNVTGKWSLIDTALSFTVNADNAWNVTTTDVTDTSSVSMANEGWYRVRLAPLTITASSNPGNVTVTVIVYEEDSAIPWGDTVRFTHTTPVHTTTPTDDPNKYLTQSFIHDLYLPNDMPVYVHVIVTHDITGETVEVDGNVYIDSFERYQKLHWDYRNRLKKVEKFIVIDFCTTGDIHDYVSKEGEIEFKYDVFDQLVAKIRNDSSGTQTDATYYVNEFGRRVLQYDDQSRVERHSMYAPGVATPLTVEDRDYDGTAPTSELIWLLGDHQGTVRDLFVLGDVPYHLPYDTFGNRQLAWDDWDASTDFVTTDSVMHAYMGMPFDPDVGMYFDGSRHYDAVGGRFMSEHPARYSTGQTNLYVFAGNTPVNRNGASTPTTTPNFGGGETFVSALLDQPGFKSVIGGLQTIGGAVQFAGGTAFNHDRHWRGGRPSADGAWDLTTSKQEPARMSAEST